MTSGENTTTGANVLLDVSGMNVASGSESVNGNSSEVGEYVMTERRSATGPVTNSVRPKWISF